MNNIGAMGASIFPVLTSFILIGAGASSILVEDSEDLAQEAEHIVNDVIEEITTYFTIDDVVGKYDTTNGVRSIKKIAILIKPFIQSTINLSEMTIKISNQHDLIILRFSSHVMERSTEGIFEHPIWLNTDHAFSIIVLIDTDRSVIDYTVMNNDFVILAIKLPDQFTMKNDESITISLVPPHGITRSVILETPSFHSSDIISFKAI